MPVKEMDPEFAWKAIEGYANELVPEQKSLDAFYRQFKCPRCGGNCRKEVLSARHAFSDPETLVPRSVLRCLSCDCLFDPHTGMRLEMGNPAKVPPDIPIIRPRDD